MRFTTQYDAHSVYWMVNQVDSGPDVKFRGQDRVVLPPIFILP